MKPLTILPVYPSSSCLWFLFVLSICTICSCDQNSDHVLCIPSERLALIHLKNNLIDEANRLSSWVGKDCCTWSGVVCDNITGHVYEIHLRGPDDGKCHRSFDTEDEFKKDSRQMLGGTLSPSVIKLLQLRHLDLSCNNFGFSSIPGFIGSFQNLIYLNLSYSNFSGAIPHQLGNLSTLRVLDLRDDPIYGNYHSKSLTWLSKLTRLQYLDMSGLYLAEASDWFRVISNLTSLLELKLSCCVLDEIPNNSTTVSFTSLIVLDLSNNVFNSILFGWIFSLRNLAILDLTSCCITDVNLGTYSGFQNMPFLKTLRVSSNTFMNSSSMLDGLSGLSNLRLLDVSFCDISSPILGKLQNLSLIEHVDLSYNGIVEEIPKSLSNLCNITTLNLRSNKFSGNVLELFKRLCECETPKLESLDFNGNYLIGQLPERLGRLKNLIRIDLGDNDLTGSIPDSLGSLSLLQTLDISVNQLSGSIPHTIGGLLSLVSLHLSFNMLNGSLPESIGQLSKLYELHLHQNSLTGILTEKHFSKLTALKTLYVGDNKLVFKLNVNKWIPPFKLNELSAHSCNLGPQFPSWIQSQRDLTRLDVANTNISDTIPGWFWTTFSSVRYLNISRNNIQGKVEDVTFLAPNAILDLSDNHLHGSLPGNLDRADLYHLDLSNNNLSGSLDQFLCSSIQEQQGLRVLNLANNNMSGVIPNCWMNWQYLVNLNLEKNQFSGIIPPSLGNLSSLEVLDMDDNMLSGNLPAWLLNSNSLVAIELAKNELMGKLPTSIGRNNTSLRVLSLRSNKFEGKIPNEICHLSFVQILDLSHNDLSGKLPTCFTNFSFMSGMETSGLYLQEGDLSALLVTKGNTYAYSTILYLVTSLDLSNNRFSGTIPIEIVGLLGLRYLNLSHNDLSGRIPNSFSHIGKLESLDLSMNHLDGNIPSSLSQLTALSWLNVSYNNLVGRIPTGRQFQTFSEFSFTGNVLCGDPLPACLQNNGDAEGTTDQHDESNGIDWTLLILTLAGLVVGFWIVITPLFLSRRWRISYYHFLEETWFKLQNFFFL